MHPGKFHAVLTWLLLATCGCATLSHPDQTTQEHEPLLRHHRRTDQPPETVDVGGFVSHPQAIEIPETGLTLIQAITRAGDVRLFSLDNPNTPEPLMFAALQRTSQFARQTHYIPVSLVRQSVLGGVPLREGDIVQVVRFEDTRLNEFSSGASEASFSVEGLVPKSAEFPIDVRGNIFASLTSYAGDYATLGATLFTVTRSNETGLTLEHFYVPVSWLGTDTRVQDAAIFPNDQITFTTFERLPLVQAALVADAQRGQQVREKRRRLLVADRQQPASTSSIPGVETVQQAGRSFLGIFGIR